MSQYHRPLPMLFKSADGKLQGIDLELFRLTVSHGIVS